MPPKKTRLTPRELAALIKATSEMNVQPTRSRRRSRRRRRGSTATMSSVPAAMTVVQGYKPPRMSGGVGTISVTHSEICISPSVSAAANVQVFRLIPSFPPWLRGIAFNFSKYRWISLQAVYVPSCPSTTSGSIHMAIRYDEVDSDPTTVVEISSMQSYSTGAIWSGAQGAQLLSRAAGSRVPPGTICTTLDCSRVGKPWYPVRDLAGIPADGDLANTVVPATLVVATEGGSGTTPLIVGHVHWVYTIQLIEPIPANLNQQSPSSTAINPVSLLPAPEINTERSRTRA